MKNNYILQNKELVRSGTMLHFGDCPPGLPLTEDSWILIPTSGDNLLAYAVLIEIYEGNRNLQRYVVEKDRSILVAFSGKIWEFLFDTTPKFSKCYILKSDLQGGI